MHLSLYIQKADRPQKYLSLHILAKTLLEPHVHKGHADPRFIKFVSFLDLSNFWKFRQASPQPLQGDEKHQARPESHAAGEVGLKNNDPWVRHLFINEHNLIDGGINTVFWRKVESCCFYFDVSRFLLCIFAFLSLNWLSLHSSVTRGAEGKGGALCPHLWSAAAAAGETLDKSECTWMQEWVDIVHSTRWR